MKTLKIIFLITALAISILFYIDYKKNPITYIILSKKFEVVSYLFFRDLPAIYPSNNYYSIRYERKSDISELNDFFTKTEQSESISIPADTYRTGIPQKLRKLFNHYAKLDPQKKEDQEIIKNIIGTYREDIEGRLEVIMSLYRNDELILEGKDLQKRIAEYINLFSKKFLVQYIAKYNEDEQCGKNSYDVAVIFDSNPSRILVIGFTNSNKICFILDENVIPFNKYDVKRFTEEYPNYWL